MKLAVATVTPEVTATVPVALLSGSLEERLRKAAALGYDGVELMVVRPADLDAQAIRALLRSLNLEAAAVATGALARVEGLTLLAQNPEVSQQAMVRLQEVVDFASEIGASLVTVGSFRGRLAWAGIGGREKLVRVLSQACAHGATKGVRLALEPLNRYESDCIHCVDEALKFVREVGHDNLGVLVDTFHANIEEPSIVGGLSQAMAAGRLWHVHVGDSNRLSPGRGHIHFGEIMTVLRALGYQGYLSAELLGHPDPDAAAAATVQYMRHWMPRSRP